jgi:hypothetical protein
MLRQMRADEVAGPRKKSERSVGITDTVDTGQWVLRKANRRMKACQTSVGSSTKNREGLVGGSLDKKNGTLVLGMRDSSI